MIRDLERLVHDDPDLRRGEFGLLAAVLISAMKDQDRGFFEDETVFLMLCSWLKVPPEKFRREVLK